LRGFTSTVTRGGRGEGGNWGPPPPAPIPPLPSPRKPFAKKATLSTLPPPLTPLNPRPPPLGWSPAGWVLRRVRRGLFGLPKGRVWGVRAVAALGWFVAWWQRRARRWPSLSPFWGLGYLWVILSCFLAYLVVHLSRWWGGPASLVSLGGALWLLVLWLVRFFARLCLFRPLLRFSPLAACPLRALVWLSSARSFLRLVAPVLVGSPGSACPLGRRLPLWLAFGRPGCPVRLLLASGAPRSCPACGSSRFRSLLRWRWPVASGSALVGFCGSRYLPPSFLPLVGGAVASALAAGCGVAVGCASGADALVRSACPGARVFRVSSLGLGRAAFVRRSVALVRAVAASGPGAAFVGFVVGPCPAGVSPSPSPSACFCGGGSGSWASLALAAGLGLPVFVFWCGGGSFPRPVSWGGSWSRVSSGLFAGAWSLAPAQASLF